MDSLKYDSTKHKLTLIPLELSDLKSVRTFAKSTLEKLGQDKVDFALLNAALTGAATKPGPHGSRWSEPYIVNHLCACLP